MIYFFLYAFVFVAYVLPGAYYWEDFSKYFLTLLFLGFALYSFESKKLTIHRIFFMGFMFAYCLLKYLDDSIVEGFIFFIQMVSLMGILYSKKFNIGKVNFHLVVNVWVTIVIVNLFLFKGHDGMPSLGFVDRNISSMFLLFLFYVVSLSGLRIQSAIIVIAGLMIGSRNFIFSVLLFYLIQSVPNSLYKFIRLIFGSGLWRTFVIFLLFMLTYSLALLYGDFVIVEDSYSGLSRLMQVFDTSNLERINANIRAIDFWLTPENFLTGSSQRYFFVDDGIPEQAFAHNAFLKDLVKIGTLGFLFKYFLLNKYFSIASVSRDKLSFVVSSIFFSFFLDGYSILGGLMLLFCYKFGSGNKVNK